MLIRIMSARPQAVLFAVVLSVITTRLESRAGKARVFRAGFQNRRSPQ